MMSYIKSTFTYKICDLSMPEVKKKQKVIGRTGIVDCDFRQMTDEIRPAIKLVRRSYVTNNFSKISNRLVPKRRRSYKKQFWPMLLCMWLGEKFW